MPKKPVNSVDLALSAVELIKSAALVFGVLILEWARTKQRQAEKRQAVAESNEKTAKEIAHVDAVSSKKLARDIIAEHLANSRKNREK